MEEKYCERCGLYLGMVRPTRKYCSECKRKVDKERDRKHRKAGITFKPRKAFCAYCGKPMLKKVASQKYHNGCAKKAYNAKANLNAKAAYKVKQQEKKKLEKTISVYRRSTSPCGQAWQALWRGVTDACNRGADL